jgi:drug/metabolite transporter (DMT)-like permease
MRDLLSGLLGVPATILIAAGLGLAAVTLVSRVRRRRDPPIRWAHLGLGLGLLACGSALLWLDVAVLPPTR